MLGKRDAVCTCFRGICNNELPGLTVFPTGLDLYIGHAKAPFDGLNAEVAREILGRVVQLVAWPAAKALSLWQSAPPTKLSRFGPRRARRKSPQKNRSMPKEIVYCSGLVT